MEEKYFIIDVRNRECGPFTEDDLNYVGLYEDTLIFCADWNERKPLNQIRELDHIHRKSESIKPHNSNYGMNLILITKTSTEIKENEEFVNPFSFQSKKVRIVVVSWLFFHSIALLFSSIGIQNDERGESYDEVWPYVNFFKEGEWHPLFGSPKNRPWYDFQGVFYQYDISEFIFYNLSALFFWFLFYTKNQKS
jgi:hypothetical protein